MPATALDLQPLHRLCRRQVAHSDRNIAAECQTVLERELAHAIEHVLHGCHLHRITFRSCVRDLQCGVQHRLVEHNAIDEPDTQRFLGGDILAEADHFKCDLCPACFSKLVIIPVGVR